MSWPNSFRLIVAGNNPTSDMTLTPDGYVIWKPNTNASDTLKIRVTVDGVTDVITIPIKFL